MYLKIQGFFNLLVVALIAPFALSAQETREGDALVTSIDTGGLFKAVQVTDPSIKRVIFEARSRGSNSHYVTVEANGPEGLSGKIEIQGVSGERFSPMYLLEFDGKRKKKQTILKDKPTEAGSIPVTAMATADGTPENIARIKAGTGLSEATIRILLQVYTPDEIIEKYANANPGGNPGEPGGPEGPTSAPGKLGGRGIVHKDGCKGGVAQHRLRFIVDLSAIDPAAYTAGFSVNAKIDSEKGSLVAASVKPVSDGKYAPKPLLLLEGVGYSYFGTESVNMVSWKGGKPRSVKSVRVEDYVSYHGYRLARIVAGFLGGGSATFEITNGEEVGNACLKLVRSRQRVNGYPG